MRRFAAVVLAAAVAAGGSGCGGDDRLSKDEYVQRMQEINRAAEPVNRLVVDLTVRARSDAQWVATRQRAVDGLSAIVSDMDALDPPEEIDGVHDRYVDHLRGCNDGLEAIPPPGGAARRPETAATVVVFRCRLERFKLSRDFAEKGYGFLLPPEARQP